MYCINCGATVDEDSVFCTNCGKRIKAEPVVTVAEEEAQAAAAPVTAAVPAEEPVVSQPEISPAPAYSASYTAGWSEQPVMPVVPEKAEPEKVFFGKGALAFCLVVIGLLAISTGVFAGLYFSLL